VTEAHWQNLLVAMGREDLKGNPDFETNPERTKRMAETEAMVTAWTSTLTKNEVAAIAKRLRIPSAPVRNAVEVMNDAHMHERGMLQHVNHPSLGDVILPNSPLRLHGADRVDPVPSPLLGQHNVDVYGEWLGLGTDAVATLVRDGVI
jgi:crotonobetainyl-CoA:carnitine CoA-transferase CaiB-like acyl-CoA transferase